MSSTKYHLDLRGRPAEAVRTDERGELVYTSEGGVVETVALLKEADKRERGAKLLRKGGGKGRGRKKGGRKGGKKG
jgi:hypothetical protein